MPLPARTHACAHMPRHCTCIRTDPALLLACEGRAAAESINGCHVQAVGLLVLDRIIYWDQGLRVCPVRASSVTMVFILLTCQIHRQTTDMDTWPDQTQRVIRLVWGQGHPTSSQCYVAAEELIVLERMAIHAHICLSALCGNCMSIRWGQALCSREAAAMSCLSTTAGTLQARGPCPCASNFASSKPRPQLGSDMQ